MSEYPDTIAHWEGLAIGIDMQDDESLETQKTRLERQRRNTVEQIAARKVEIIETEAAGEKPASERLTKLNLDLERSMAELETIERKLKVFSESLQQLRGSDN